MNNLILLTELKKEKKREMIKRDKNESNNQPNDTWHFLNGVR